MKKRHIIILIIITIAISSISIYIELIMKPQNLNMNSGRTSPFVVYFHSNLSILIDGKPFKVPSQIGIDNDLWNDHSLDKFGYPGMPMDKEGKTTMPGMAPIYTTNDKGRITVGSIVDRDYSLGEFLRIWGKVDLKDKEVYATADGKRVSHYENIILKNKQKIALNITTSQ